MVATAAEMRPGEPVTIGGPIPNYTIYVADEALSLLGPGQQGELLIGGPGVATRLPRAARADRGEIHRQPVRAGWDGPGPLPLGRCGHARRGRQHPVPRPHRRPGEDPRLPGGARRDRGAHPAPARHQPGGGGAAPGRRRRPPRRLPGAGARRRDRPGSPAPDPRRPDAALHGAGPFRGRDGAAAPDLRQGRPQGPEGRPADGRGRPRASRSPRQRDRGGAARRGRTRSSAPSRSPSRAISSPISAAIRCWRPASSSAVRETPALAGITLQDVYALRSLRAMSDALIERTGGAGSQAAIRDLSLRGAAARCAAPSAASPRRPRCPS